MCVWTKEEGDEDEDEKVAELDRQQERKRNSKRVTVRFRLITLNVYHLTVTSNEMVISQNININIRRTHRKLNESVYRIDLLGAGTRGGTGYLL